MSTKSKSKQQEALQILDDLDSLSPDSRAAGVDSTAAATPPINATPGEAADVLAFLDEITQKSSEPTRTAASLLDRPSSRSGTPTPRKTTERVRVAERQAATPAHERQPSGGGWGWGTVWSNASSALQQARTVVDEQVKNLPTQDAKKWREGVLEYAKSAQERAQEYAKTAQLEKLGSSYDFVASL